MVPSSSRKSTRLFDPGSRPLSGTRNANAVGSTGSALFSTTKVAEASAGSKLPTRSERVRSTASSLAKTDPVMRATGSSSSRANVTSTSPCVAEVNSGAVTKVDAPDLPVNTR